MREEKSAHVRGNFRQAFQLSPGLRIAHHRTTFGAEQGDAKRDVREYFNGVWKFAD